MAKCYICEKEAAFGNQFSHSHRISSKIWRPNIKKIKILDGATPKTVNVCTRCIRSGKVNRAV